MGLETQRAPPVPPILLRRGKKAPVEAFTDAAVFLPFRVGPEGGDNINIRHSSRIGPLRKEEREKGMKCMFYIHTQGKKIIKKTDTWNICFMYSSSFQFQGGGHLGGSAVHALYIFLGGLHSM